MREWKWGAILALTAGGVAAAGGLLDLGLDFVVGFGLLGLILALLVLADR